MIPSPRAPRTPSRHWRIPHMYRSGLMLRTSVAVLLSSLGVAPLLKPQQPTACPVDVSCPACDPPRIADPVTALREGNSRFVKRDPKHVHQSVECGKRL